MAHYCSHFNALIFILYVELNSIYWNTNLSLFFPREFSHLYFIFFTTLRILITQTINRSQWRRIQFMSRCFAPKDITRRNILLWDVFAEIKKKISGSWGVGWAKFCAFLSFCFLLQPLRSVFAIFSWLNPLYLCHKLGCTCLMHDLLSFSNHISFLYIFMWVGDGERG